MKNENKMKETAFEAIPLPWEPALSGNQIHNRQRGPRLPRKLLYPMLEQWAARGEIECVTMGCMFYYRRVEGHDPLARGPGTIYNADTSNVSRNPNVDEFVEALRPLRNGQPVKLWLDLQGTPGKKKLRSNHRKLVIICPASAAGLPPMTVLVAIPGRGSSVLRPFTGEGLADLVLAGVPARLANELMNKIHQVMKG